jgi:SAM-dependent methyltransferase
MSSRPGPRTLSPGALALSLLHARSVLANSLVDRWLGVDTYDRVDLGAFGRDHPEHEAYEGSDWRVVKRLLKGTVTSEDVFLDLGSGKGRAVLQAARLPFRRVIGVDVAPELTAIARRNVECTRRRLRCQDVQLVTADAATYRVPDDVSVAYLFNPFVGETFDRVIERLLESATRRARRLRLVYVHPTGHARLLESPRVRVVREFPTPPLHCWLAGGQAPERFACIYELGR